MSCNKAINGDRWKVNSINMLKKIKTKSIVMYILRLSVLCAPWHLSSLNHTLAAVHVFARLPLYACTSMPHTYTHAYTIHMHMSMCTNTHMHTYYWIIV